MALVLGLDLGPVDVRAALLRTAMRKMEVVRYLDAPVEVPAGQPGHEEAVRAAVQHIVRELGRPPDRIVTSLDGQEASLRVIELPAGAAKRIGEVLPFELESLLPFPTEEAIVDYQLIDRRDAQIRLIAAAAPRERIAARIAELRDAGIEPKELAVGAAALDGLVQLLPMLQSPGPFLLLDLQGHETDVCIIENGRCAAVRTLSLGLDDLESGRLERELKATLTSWRAAGAAQPTEIILMGPGSTWVDMDQWISSKLLIPARNIPLPVVEGGHHGTSKFGRAVALAARTTAREKRIDLLQGEFAPKRALGAIRQHAKLASICAGVILLCFAFATWARWAMLDDQNEILAAELARVTEEAFGEETSSPTRVTELLERGPRDGDPLPKFDAYEALDAISSLIPPEITHDTRRLHIELDEDGHGGRFSLEGTVASVAERDQIAAAIDGHDCFQDIEKGRTTPGPGNQGLNYQIEAKIRCPGAPAPAEERRRRSGS